jgi:predicted  nucleic acid-binding Zn-ribbon protein
VEALGKIDIEMNQHNSRKSKEETLAAIQEMSQIDLLKINKWLVNPSSQFQALAQEVKRIQERLPQVERKLYTFEVNETIEPSRLVVEFLDRCNQCIEHGKASTVVSR